MVKVLYFFNLVDKLGCAQDEQNLDAGLVSVADLLAALGKRGEKYSAALGDGSKLQVTINKKFSEASSPVCDGDEVAFFPNAR